MVVCARCGDDASEAIQCSVCLHFFDFACSGITEKGYRKLGDRQATWRCANCKSAGAHLTATSSSANSPTVSLDSVMRELMNINLKLAPLSSLESEVQSLRKELSDLKSLALELPVKIQTLEERILKVEKAQEDSNELTKIVRKLETDQQASEQWLRSNNIEIKGVPLKDRENLFDVITKIGTSISYPIERQKINFIHRVPTHQSGIKNIIVSFINKYVKEDFISAARLRKDILTPNDIGLNGAGRIFVNDHLTTRNKTLLSKAKALAKEHNYQFIWVKNMKIFARKNNTTRKNCLMLPLTYS
ncbi:hypothetical protein K1T71_001434 [Dendrolimus kikuchii]|uniref:Uncharacterized protein n=1 Tax=Dendrolimus kikuchii TaxID=765133 RepID=A0ACC1DHP7_9NEOP|nr:hypothetical protein K1T71_001434 [Dendrolimus kikuchii]